MDKIKVLEIIQQGEIGGGESHLLTLLSKLDRNRFEPIVMLSTAVCLSISWFGKK
jgi:hypothetical protein